VFFVSVKASTWAWQMPLKGNEKLVLLALADHANDEGKCWPKVTSIAEKCGLDRTTVIAQLKKLHELNIFSKETVYDNLGRKRGNVYTLTINLSGESLRSELLRWKSLRSENYATKSDLPLSLGGNFPPLIIESSLITINESSIKENKKEKKEIYNKSDFEKLWEAYPRKVSKEAARKVFEKINPTSDALRIMLEAVSNQATERILAKRYGEWRPEWKHLSTWLNGKNWEDEINLNEEDWKNDSRNKNTVENKRSSKPETKSEMVARLCTPTELQGRTWEIPAD
jgi:DNA-binding MarR family transcriptional regulator